MNLGELKPAYGSNSKSWRRGRGHASGNGKTAGRGHKGQGARSGSGGKAGATDLDGVVAELRKSMPNATQAELVIKAYETNPNLDPYTGKLK